MPPNINSAILTRLTVNAPTSFLNFSQLVMNLIINSGSPMSPFRNASSVSNISRAFSFAFQKFSLASARFLFTRSRIPASASRKPFNPPRTPANSALPSISSSNPLSVATVMTAKPIESANFPAGSLVNSSCSLSVRISPLTLDRFSASSPSCFSVLATATSSLILLTSPLKLARGCNPSLTCVQRF